MAMVHEKETIWRQIQVKLKKTYTAAATMIQYPSRNPAEYTF